MEVFSSVAGTLSRCLPLESFAQSFRYVASCKSLVDSLAGEMNELRSKRDDVKREVDKARREGRDPKNQVVSWLDTVEDLESKTDDIAKEFDKRITVLGLIGINIWSDYWLSRRAEESLADARDLKLKGDFAELADDFRPVRFAEMPDVPALVGMEDVLDQLQLLVNDGDVGVIGIYGMAGVGKTAILSRFNNKYLAGATYLELVISVEVTMNVDVEGIQEAIRDRLKLSWGQERKSPMERAAILRKALQKMEFVVFLDDLWEPLNLHDVGIPVPRRGTKQTIIITTTKENVCDSMDATKKMKVECLGWEHSWFLFSSMVGEERINSNPAIRSHAEDLAKKCGGLPLALAHIGRAMRCRTSPDDWKHTARALEVSPWQLQGMQENVLQRLKRSYDNLSDHKLRTYLLYCSLYPEGYKLWKKWIIDYGIGEGVVDDLLPGVDGIYQVGHYLLGNLKAASLIERYEEEEEYIKMHPMIRAMVCWVLCDYGTNASKLVVRTKFGLREAFAAEEWGKAEWISLMDNDIELLPEDPNCLALKVLMLQRNRRLEQIPHGFFLYMPSLRVLELSDTAIKEIPAAVGALVSLQYLDLYNTKITSLPVEFKALRHLRTLFLSHTPLLGKIPEGVIASLTQLRVLNMFHSFRWWKVGSVGYGVDLREVEGLKQLKTVGITVGTPRCLQRLVQSNRLAQSIHDLKIVCFEWPETIYLPFEFPGEELIGLRWLQISDSSDLKEVIIGTKSSYGVGVNENSLLNLEGLTVAYLEKAKIVWKGRALQNLRTLHIWSCKSMEQVIYYYVDATPKEEQEEEEVEEEEEVHDGGFIPFPNVTKMYLYDLPKLRRLSSRRIAFDFPSLEELKVDRCPKLKKLRLDGAEKMREIRGLKAWWDELEWDGDSFTRAFHLFKEQS